MYGNQIKIEPNLRIWRFSDVMDDIIVRVTSHGAFVMSSNVFMTTHDVFVKPASWGPGGGSERVSKNEKSDIESINLTII